MCVIIVNQNGKPLPKDVAKTSARLNPHGLGVMWMDNFKVTYHKSTEYKVLFTKRPFIAHFRYATVGAIGRSNTHPFVCGKNENEWLMMNGTIYGLGDAHKCDSKVLAEQLGEIPRNKWKDTLEKHLCRFVTINTRNKSYQMYNKYLWTQKDGIWYSKSNVLEENVVAVYGTLKRGLGNHHYIEDSKYVGKGKTKDKYPLVVSGLPYLIEEKDKGHHVEVEVYKVDDDTLRRLDSLEGHPNWYERKKVDIKLNTGTVVKAWIYFNKRERSAGHELHKTFTHAAYKRSYEPIVHISDMFDDAEFVIDDESPVCVNCYHDLEHDYFGNYYCQSCGDWFSENEIVKFRNQI